MTYEMVLNYIRNGLLDEELVSLWNEYAKADLHIFDFSDPETFFNENFSTPYEAFRASYCGSVDYADDYIAFDGYGNLESFNYFDDYGNDCDLAMWLFPHWQDHFKEEDILEYWKEKCRQECEEEDIIEYWRKKALTNS